MLRLKIYVYKVDLRPKFKSKDQIKSLQRTFMSSVLQKNPAIVTHADLKSYFYRFRLANLQSVFLKHVIQSKRKFYWIQEGYFKEFSPWQRLSNLHHSMKVVHFVSTIPKDSLGQILTDIYLISLTLFKRANTLLYCQHPAIKNYGTRHSCYCLLCSDPGYQNWLFWSRTCQ